MSGALQRCLEECLKLITLSVIGNRFAVVAVEIRPPPARTKIGALACYGKEALTSYKIKKLSWESTALRKIKKRLDKKYNKRLSKRARDRIEPRTVRSRQNVTLLNFVNGPLMLKHQILILQPLHLCDCRTIFIS